MPLWYGRDKDTVYAVCMKKREKRKYENRQWNERDIFLSLGQGIFSALVGNVRMESGVGKPTFSWKNVTFGDISIKDHTTSDGAITVGTRAVLIADFQVKSSLFEKVSC